MLSTRNPSGNTIDTCDFVSVLAALSIIQGRVALATTTPGAYVTSQAVKGNGPSYNYTAYRRYKSQAILHVVYMVFTSIHSIIFFLIFLIYNFNFFHFHYHRKPSVLYYLPMVTTTCTSTRW
mgnify:CR=1 FL=1